jgi:hypothetical protein
VLRPRDYHRVTPASKTLERVLSEHKLSKLNLGHRSEPFAASPDSPDPFRDFTSGAPIFAYLFKGILGKPEQASSATPRPTSVHQQNSRRHRQRMRPKLKINFIFHTLKQRSAGFQHVNVKNFHIIPCKRDLQLQYQ